MSKLPNINQEDMPLHFCKDGYSFKHILVIRSLSKAMLRFHFECSNRMLRKYYLTDTVLESAGLSIYEYKKIHSGYFTPIHAKKIFKLLDITYLRVPY